MAKERYVRTLEPYFVKRDEFDPFWWYSNPQNLLDNGDFELWTAGTAVAPDGWTLTGAGASVARNAVTVKRCSYSAAVTNAVGVVAILYQRIALPCAAFYRGLNVSISCWVWADTPNRVRIRARDGVAVSDSDRHPGDSAWHLLTATLQVDLAANLVEFRMTIVAGAAITAYGDAAHMCLSPVPRAFAPKPTLNAARIATGSYTGDGTVSMAVTGIGFWPKYVRIWERSTDPLADIDVFETTAEILDDDASGMSAMHRASQNQFEVDDDRIISLDADGFTVDDQGVNGHPNAAQVTYNYMCIG